MLKVGRYYSHWCEKVIIIITNIDKWISLCCTLDVELITIIGVLNLKLMIFMIVYSLYEKRLSVYVNSISLYNN